MATLERIHFVPHYLVRRENAVAYSPSSSRPSIEGLPQIFWADCGFRSIVTGRFG